MTGSTVIFLMPARNVHPASGLREAPKGCYRWRECVQLGRRCVHRMPT